MAMQSKLLTSGRELSGSFSHISFCLISDVGNLELVLH